MATSDNLHLIRDRDLVYSSFRAVIQCEKDGPDSLKADLFPSSDTTSQVLSEFCIELLQAMHSILNFGQQIKLKYFQEQSLVKFHALKINKLSGVLSQ